MLDELTSSVSASAARPRRTTAFVVGLAMVVVISVCVLATSASNTTRVSVRSAASDVSIPGGLSDKTILAIVERSAASEGELRPTNVQWLATTRGVAFDLMGEPQGSGATDLDHAVIYIQAFGKFTVIVRGPRPQNGSPAPVAPNGSCLQMAIDRTTGQELDGGVGGACADLSGLSGVHTAG